MQRVTYEQFCLAYADAVESIAAFWNPEMQDEISRHNRGWARGRTDFIEYLHCSVTRYWVAFGAISSESTDSVCDVGGFWGAWPLTLKRLGVGRAAMTEALRYYSTSFGPLFEYLDLEGVEVVDFDLFEDTSGPAGFDVVTSMAVLEHYPHSPRRALEMMTQMLDEGGRLYIEVPNIAYWPKRIELLRGRTPLVPITDIFDSEVPFTGHHHEYTATELLSLCDRAGLEVTMQQAFNYSWVDLIKRKPMEVLLHPLSAAAFALSPTTREVVAVLCQRKR